MVIIDNYLDQASFLSLSMALLAPTFPWEKSAILKDPPENFPPEQNLQYVHGFYLQNSKRVYRSNQLKLLRPLIEKINPIRLIKVKVNLTTRQTQQAAYAFHVDTKQTGATTAVLYLNTNNGYTLFENGQKIDSVANRVVFFDSAMPHSGVQCTDAEKRVVLNLNMISGNTPHCQ